jgi:hypothetical protein
VNLAAPVPAPPSPGSRHQEPGSVRGAQSGRRLSRGQREANISVLPENGSASNRLGSLGSFRASVARTLLADG